MRNLSSVLLAAGVLLTGSAAIVPTHAGAQVSADRKAHADKLAQLRLAQNASPKGGQAQRPGGFGPGGPGGPGGMGGPGRGPGGPPRPGQILPGFLQEQLKLTAGQKKEIDQLQKEVDAKLGKILTADQKKQMQEFRNRRPGGPGGPGGMGGPGGGRGGFGGPPPGL